MTRIAVILGSTRPGRAGEGVAQWVIDHVGDHKGVEFELVDVADAGLPLLDEPLPAGSGVYSKDHTRAWSSVIERFDGYVFVTAEYNHSIPAAFKNAFDFLYREWARKPVGFVSYGADGGIRAVEHWRSVVANAQMVDVRAAVALSLFTDFTDGAFTPGPRREDELALLLEQLLPLAEALRTLRSA